MPEQLLHQLWAWLAGAALAAFAGALAVSRGPHGRVAGWLGLAGLILGAVLLGLVVWAAQRPPLIGVLESISEIALLTSALALADWWSGAPGHAAARWSWLWCLILWGLLLLLPRQLHPDSYMFDYPGLILFFQMRLAAIALLLHAASRHLAWCKADQPGPLDCRRLLLAGMAAFLVSELAGAIWSFFWTGEFWHWNRGFLESAALFMVIALPLHLPASWARRPGLARAAGVAPGLVLAGVTLLHQVSNG